MRRSFKTPKNLMPRSVRVGAGSMSLRRDMLAGCVRDLMRRPLPLPRHLRQKLTASPSLRPASRSASAPKAMQLAQADAPRRCPRAASRSRTGCPALRGARLRLAVQPAGDEAADHGSSSFQATIRDAPAMP